MNVAKVMTTGVVGALVAGLVFLGCSDDERRCFGQSRTYAIGETFDDGCRACTCNDDASITCAATESCAVGCEDSDGASHDLGSFWSAGDGCNVCQCVAVGDISCTENACGVPCVYVGEQRTPGSSFPSIDGCNTCECQSDGTVSCTEEACACDAASEWWREYAGMSPTECAAITLMCPETTTAFENSCGCGCEQSHACAEAYDCMPPNACDLEQLRSDCPYSEILE